MVNYSGLMERTRKAFASGKTRKLEWRKQQLLALITMLEKEVDGFCQALNKDLRKHSHESLFMEVNLTKNDAILAYNNIDEWAQPEKPENEAMIMEVLASKNEAISMFNNLDEWVSPQKVAKNLLTISDNCYIQNEPRGVSLIIGAWNYPVQLVLLPLVGAIAAGNCAVIKPSEVAPATADFIEEVIPKYLDHECIHVINGGIPETQALLAERWDHIFYTGNNTVAKIVYEAAAKHLTPVILELGGKSPCFVDESSDLNLVSRRILWGKFVNSGQTCIAPDYVMCTPQVQDKLLARLETNLKIFYGDDVQKSTSYGRIVNSRHFGRVKSIFSGADIAIGGKTDESDNYIEPTVLRNCKPTDRAMKDEIFGPVLPVMPVRDEDEAIDFINSMEKPLAMYIFSKNKKQVEKLIQSTSSGGVTVNDTVMHAALESLPFGGTGHSGIGSYHGKFSFLAFSHQRAVMHRPQSLEKVNDLRYPPYTERKGKLIAWVMGKKPKHSGYMRGLFSFVKIVVFGVFVGFIAKQLGIDKYLPEALR